MLLDLLKSKFKEATNSSSQHDPGERISLESPSPPPEEVIAPGQIIDEVVQKVLSGMPLRFINLDTGAFSSSADLSHIFKHSPEYEMLVSNKSLTYDDLTEQANGVVRKYFAYVMLSHVWGEDEPLYGDIKSIANVLEMSSSSPGTTKLQNFCRTAKQRGFRWCWSDTCCIDKSSSAELQESINSMFTWYRNSALTIAFLLDVLQSTPDALKQSRWFTRGWTLQELLAPTAIVVYRGDWTPFHALPMGDTATPLNDKLNPQFIQCLEDVLGIDKSYLVDFNPGLDDVREKLRWMAVRRTTKVEDRAYCLLGILDLRLPVLYGEGERAFTRLQEEIMKNTDDTCIFDWVGKPSSLNSFLARSPSCFRQASWHPPHRMTLEVPVLGVVSDLSHKLSAKLVQAAEGLLDEPPLGHFIANGRMNLRTFVYRIRSVELASSTDVRMQPLYTYRVKAEGLEPLTVVTRYKLPDLSATRALSIGRIWDNALRMIPGSASKAQQTHKGSDESDDSASDDFNPWSLKGSDYVAMLAKRLREPFVAQLLLAFPSGVFCRVHTEERIVARPRIGDLLDLRVPRTLIVH